MNRLPSRHRGRQGQCGERDKVGEAALALRRESEQPTTRRTRLLAPLAPRPFTGTPPASAARRDAPGGAGPSAAVMSAATTTRYPASAGWATSGDTIVHPAAATLPAPDHPRRRRAPRSPSHRRLWNRPAAESPGSMTGAAPLNQRPAGALFVVPSEPARGVGEGGKSLRRRKRVS
jgi:hypothetical protein